MGTVTFHRAYRDSGLRKSLEQKGMKPLETYNTLIQQPLTASSGPASERGFMAIRLHSDSARSSTRFGDHIERARPSDGV
jgi:hypothetical protein